jgi:hypothetical protein
MKVITFCELDKSLFNPSFVVENFNSKTEDLADIVILDIQTIFDYEENKHQICKDKYVSIAVLEDEGDYDAFKNFGIDAWIRSNDLPQINNLINLLNKRFLA